MENFTYLCTVRDDVAKGARRAPLLFVGKTNCTMIEKSLIEAIANDYLAATDLKLVRVKFSKENDITVYIHRSGAGVCIDDCVALSRHIESRLDRDKEDFSLTVSSAGTGYKDEEE